MQPVLDDLAFGEAGLVMTARSLGAGCRLGQRGGMVSLGTVTVSGVGR